MSTCFKCGTENNAGAKYCGSCNALLPKQAPTGIPNKSVMDINEQVEYPRPEAHYKSPFLEHLAWAVHDFLEEGAEIEPVVEGYEAYKELFEQFQEQYPSLRERSYEHKQLIPGDPFPSQFNYYLVQTETHYAAGKESFEKYFDEFEAFLDTQEELDAQLPAEDADPEEIELSPEEIEKLHQQLEELEPPSPEVLIRGVKSWLECNDHVCMALEALAGWVDGFKPIAEEAGQIAAEARADLEATSVPTDSTDVG